MTEPTKPSKGRVFWTETEWQAVINEAVLVWFVDIKHLWTHLATAQSVLPENRRRTIVGNHIVNDDVREQFEKARKEFLSLQETVPAPAEIPTSTPSATPAPVPPPTPTPLDRAAIIANLTLAEIFAELAHRLGPIMAGFKAVVGIAEALAKRPEHHDSPKPETSSPSVGTPAAPNPEPATPLTQQTTKPKIPKVVLYGFSTEDGATIRGKAGSFNLELVFITSQRPGEPAPTIPVCHSCIVDHKAKLGRRVSDALELRPGKDHVHKLGNIAAVLKQLSIINSRRS